MTTNRAMPNDSGEFVGLVAYAAIVSNGNPAPLANGLEPVCILAGGWEMIQVPLDA